MKVTMSLDDELMKRIDDYAKKNYTSRSGLVTIATTQFLNANELQEVIKGMALSFAKIADNGSFSEEDRKQMEDYERICKLLVGAK